MHVIAVITHLYYLINMSIMFLHLLKCVLPSTVAMDLDCQQYLMGVGSRPLSTGEGDYLVILLRLVCDECVFQYDVLHR